MRAAGLQLGHAIVVLIVPSAYHTLLCTRPVAAVRTLLFSYLFFTTIFFLTLLDVAGTSAQDTLCGKNHTLV